MTKEQASHKESETDFFENLTLADIYGSHTLRPGTEIVTDIPYNKFNTLDWNSQERKELTRELEKKYNIPEIGGYGNHSFTQENNGNLVITAGLSKGLTYWAPHHEERKVLIELAKAISNNNKPLILEAGCGTGFLSQLLADDDKTKVVGIEKYHDQLAELPNGKAELIVANFYDAYSFFSPNMPANDKQQTETLIKYIRENILSDLKEDLDETENDPEEKLARFYASALGHNFDLGPMYKFRKELKQLQQLARKNAYNSKVDLAICSMMQQGVELTIPIRDGVVPKVIVYTRKIDGLSGLTDFWGREKIYKGNRETIPYCVSSYNPGINYRAVSKWPTVWKGNWSHKAYQLSQWLPEVEVVVQLRNDINIQKLKDIQIPYYSWDDELLEIIKSPRYIENKFTRKFEDDYGFYEEFSSGIKSTRETLISS